MQKLLSKKKLYFMSRVTIGFIFFFISAVGWYWNDRRAKGLTHAKQAPYETLIPMELSDKTTESIVEQLEIAESLQGPDESADDKVEIEHDK